MLRAALRKESRYSYPTAHVRRACSVSHTLTVLSRKVKKMFEEDQLEPSYTMSENDFVEKYGEANRESIQIALEGMKDESTGAREAAVMGFMDYIGNKPC